MALRTALMGVALALASTAPPASAVSLAPNKITDDSVCDLAPSTNYLVSRSFLVPADGSHDAQVEAYWRLAADFISTRCADGQLLIIHGSSEDRSHVDTLERVANSACTVAAVQRREVPYVLATRTEKGFELRCVMSKHAQLTKTLAEREQAEPREALQARMLAEAKAKTGGASQAATPTAGQPQRDCNKMTLGTLLRGGICP